ncbi:sigma factor-like helix-turn-helix DNA-binding protein [Micromonospora sp. NPDC049751]|uniref:sigma factor-like helix-turn-helix DNA-binding protein n=1 Tax=Micromonospora sp. NPDC049751 TaxID=3154837 RepID=UPI0033C52828
MSSYNRRLVEQLLPAVWDKDYAYGMANPEAAQPVRGCQVHAKRDGTPKEDCACCDPSVRKTTVNPKLGNTLYAHLGDIHAAWRHAGLPLEEKRALLLRYGLDWREREISAQLGVPQQTISDRLVRGVGRLVDHLNGDEHEDIDDTATLTCGSDTNP